MPPLAQVDGDLIAAEGEIQTSAFNPAVMKENFLTVNREFRKKKPLPTLSTVMETEATDNENLMTEQQDLLEYAV